MSVTKLINEMTRVTGVAPDDVRYTAYANEFAEWAVAYKSKTIINSLFVDHFKAPNSMRISHNKETGMYVLSKYNHA